MPYTQKSLDVYTGTKVVIEKAVISANGKDGLLTTIIPLSGIFGYASFIHCNRQLIIFYSPSDRQLMVNLYNIYDRGRTGVQIGNNTNLTDWTYVTNVADAHILAADKLSLSNDPPVAGEIFFITNDEPWLFWDFMNGIWDRPDVTYPSKRVKKKPLVIPRTLGTMAAISELIAWILGMKPTFTCYSIAFSCTARWHKIDKAKRALGYQPKVRLGDCTDRRMCIVLFNSSRPIEHLRC